MRARERHAGETANLGGARALPVEVKIVTAFNAVVTAGLFALAAWWGLALPAAGCAVAFLVSVFMLAHMAKGGVA